MSKILGFLPQAEGFRHMQETDYLLVTMTDAASLTGKIFEYLATRKPILAFARVGGEIDKILNETKGGWCVDPDDRFGARELLVNAAKWAAQPQGWFTPIVDEIRVFERPAQVARLAQTDGATIVAPPRARRFPSGIEADLKQYAHAHSRCGTARYRRSGVGPPCTA